jgi:glycosyltransferase involved in cell wall biosynthesis
MKVVFVSEEYPPLCGGIGVSSARVARNLVRIGVDVHVLTFDATCPESCSDYIINEVQDDVVVSRVGPFFGDTVSTASARLNESGRATLRRRAYEQMESISREIRPDVVLSFNALNAGLLGTYLARDLRVPHVISVRGADVGRNIFSFTTGAVLRTIIEGSARIVCVNKHLLDRLLLAFPNAISNAAVIPNAVELPEGIAPMPRTRLLQLTGWPLNSTVAVFLGMPREKKGISTLLRAIDLARSSALIRLLIVGQPIPATDPSCGRLYQRLVDDGVVYCTGHGSRFDALTIAASGDVIVMPSHDDGMANGLLEGMALGLCPIASDIFTDVVGPGAGCIVPRRNEVKLAEALVCCSDVQQRSTWARNALESINRNHSTVSEADAYRTLLCSLAQKHN